MKIRYLGIGGFLAGLLAPVIVMFIIYWNFDTDMNFLDFMKHGFITRMHLSYFQASLLANLAIFFPATKLRDLAFGRGILLATMIYGVVIVYMMFS